MLKVGEGDGEGHVLRWGWLGWGRWSAQYFGQAFGSSLGMPDLQQAAARVDTAPPVAQDHRRRAPPR